MSRAPYIVQIEPLIRTGEIKKFEDLNILAVLSPVELTIRWKEKQKAKKGEKAFIWKECEEKIKLRPGIVLHRRWRDLNDFEKELLPEQL